MAVGVALGGRERWISCNFVAAKAKHYPDERRGDSGDETAGDPPDIISDRDIKRCGAGRRMGFIHSRIGNHGIALSAVVVKTQLLPPPSPRCKALIAPGICESRTI